MPTPLLPKPLKPSDKPLVWIDCEMTGLNPKMDRILEVAVLITNGDLELVDDGIEFIVKTEKHHLDAMDEWCTNQHGKTGLTQACIDSPHSLNAVSQSVLDYVKGWIPGQGIAPLAGSSVWADKAFLVEGMPDLVKHLHYRIVDVSSIKEVTRRWYPEEGPDPNRPISDHRAKSDILASIAELKMYRERYFVTPTALSPKDTSAAK